MTFYKQQILVLLFLGNYFFFKCLGSDSTKLFEAYHHSDVSLNLLNQYLCGFVIEEDSSVSAGPQATHTQGASAAGGAEHTFLDRLRRVTNSLHAIPCDPKQG